MCKAYAGCWLYTNKPEYVFILHQFAYVCRNNAEYA